MCWTCSVDAFRACLSDPLSGEQPTADRAVSAEYCHARIRPNNATNIIGNRMALVGEESVSGVTAEPPPGQSGAPTHARLYHLQRRNHAVPRSARRSRASDAQREKPIGQLAELEATERVLARYSKGRQAKKAVSASAATTATKTAATPFAALHANAGKPRKSWTSDRMQWYETTMPLQGLPPVFATQLLPGSSAGREQLPCQQSALHSARSTC